MTKKYTGGKANAFQRAYLEANMIGTNYKGSEVTSVSNKYIYTKDAKHPRAGNDVSFIPRPGTEKLVSRSTAGDTEGDRL